MFKKLIITVSCGAILAGCANLNSVHRTTKHNGSVSTELMDAKQRGIVITKVVEKDEDKNLIREMYRSCSEPAPDIFSVYALALSGNLSGSLGLGDGKSEDRLTALANLSSTEAGATIERTQTINLMRESMFRTCERYMSGALDESGMSLQAARDLRAMVAILAIEQLTGTVRPQPTVLNGRSAALIAEQNSELQEKIATQEKELESSNASEISAKSQLDLAQRELETCKNGVTPTGDEGLIATQCKTQQSKFDSAKITHETALQRKKDAQKKLEDSIEISKSLALALGLTSTTGSRGSADGRYSDEYLASVSHVVNDIAKSSYSTTNEFAIACTTYFLSNQKTVNSNFEDSCLKFFKEETEIESNVSWGHFSNDFSDYDDVDRVSIFNRIWERVRGTNNEVDESKLKELLTSYLSIGFYDEMSELDTIPDSKNREELLNSTFNFFDLEDWSDMKNTLNLVD